MKMKAGGEATTAPRRRRPRKTARYESQRVKRTITTADQTWTWGECSQLSSMPKLKENKLLEPGPGNEHQNPVHGSFMALDDSGLNLDVADR